MAIVSRIKQYFFQKQLLSQRADSAYPGPLKEVKSMVFLVHSKDLDQIGAFEKWARGRFEVLDRIRFVCIDDTEVESTDTLWMLSSKKDFKWSKCLQAQAEGNVRSESFDILINLDLSNEERLLYITAIIKAQMKIGFCPNPWKIYDLLLEANQGKRTDQLHQISDILTKINSDI